MKKDFKEKVYMSWKNFQTTGEIFDALDFLQCYQQLEKSRAAKKEEEIEM